MTPLGDRPFTAIDKPVLLVPVGSCEQHGPHLPLATDTIIAEHLCSQVPDVLVTPSIGIAASGEHAGFPGTLSIGNEALTRMLIELGRSADWCAGIVFVNGHGGNTRAVSLAVSALRAESRRVAAWSPRVDGDAHAGRAETSIMLVIAPHLVDMGRAVAGNTSPLTEIIDEIHTSGVKGVSGNGVLGDPRDATRETGEQLIAEMVADLRTVVEAHRSEWH
ncbi:MAG: mycofactocin biosynthesis peptidyl-dipeptidase MftE [Ilumatobacteraceae bacterium]